MEFVWSDGGRAACGFVGLAGDCVARALSIGTGCNYRKVYDELRHAAKESPRKGLPTRVIHQFLQTRGWRLVKIGEQPFVPARLPKGVVIARLHDSRRRKGHLTTVIDHVVYDTWNPAEDEFFIDFYWIPPQKDPREATCTGTLIASAQPSLSRQQELTQMEFEKILRRLRALDSTAQNHASTEGEKRNALRMMHALLMQHNLTREDINPQNKTDQVQFTRMSCPINGRRACHWEYSLARYVCEYVFPLVQYYFFRSGHRTLFMFYGPRQDVRNCIELFKELLLTIATSATLRFGGYARGSGASYAEGYVDGLPRDLPGSQSEVGSRADGSSQGSTATGDEAWNRQVILNRAMVLHRQAGKWLELECGIRLVRERRAGRFMNDPFAKNLGKQHGSTHEIRTSQQPKRLN